MIKSLKNFVANEFGATAIEYALIASLIAVFIIGALSALGTKLIERVRRSRRSTPVSRSRLDRPPPPSRGEHNLF